MPPAPANCSQCGAPLRPTETRGLCPACLLDSSLSVDDNDATSEVPIDTAWLERNQIAVPVPATSEKTQRFGDYELFEEIGRGGMGVIYRAQQVSLRRTVAVKTILTGPLTSRDFARRFETEARAAAALDHPNIVAIYEVGNHQGQPYYSMPLIAGRDLARALKQDGPMPARPAATLLATVARAIQYAHQRGVLHRDLKPANILLDSEGQPHVTDFGLAKLLEEDDGLTLTLAALGTPNYMAPEQASGKAGDLTVAADIYSLGAILFEVLTGQRLFAAPTPLATINRARDQEPPRPSSILRSIPRDLETICLKCLEKEPHRRYATAFALAEDLERWLAGEPIHARRVGAVELLGLWCRRKPAMATMAATAVLAVVIGLAGILWQWRRAEATANRERALAEVRLRERYAADMSVVQSRIQQNNLRLARDLLQQYLPQSGQVDLRGFEWHLYDRMCRGDQIRTLLDCGDVRTMAISRNGSLLAIAGYQPGVFLFNPATNCAELRLPTRGREVCSVAFSPDDRLLAVGSDSGVWPTGTDKGVVEVWDLASRQIVATLQAKAPRVAFSPVDPLLAVGSGGEVVQWKEGEVLLWRYGEPDSKPEALPESGGRAVFSPDGKRLVTGLHDRQLTVWDMATRRPSSRLQVGSPMLSMAYSPDGTLLATGQLNGLIELWEAGTLNHLGTFRGHAGRVMGIGFLAGGKLLASAGYEETVRLWDVARQELVATHQAVGHSESLVVIPGEDTVVTGGSLYRLDFWRGTPSRQTQVLPNTDQLKFSPDGTWMLTRSTNGSLRTIDARRRQTVGAITNPVSPLTVKEHPGRASVSFLLDFAANGTAFVTYDYLTDTREVVRLRTWSFPACVVEKEVALAPLNDFRAWSVVMSPDGRLVAAGSMGGEVAVWSAGTGQLVQIHREHSKIIPALAFSPDSRVLAVSTDAGATLREVGSWRELKRFVGGAGLNGGAFSPDGELYAASCWDWNAYVWNVRTGREVAALRGHQLMARCVAFSPDGRTLATGSEDPTVRLWNISTGREMGALPNDGMVSAVTFAAQGNMLAATFGSTNTKSIRLWDASVSGPEAPEMEFERTMGIRIVEWQLAGPYAKSGVLGDELQDLRFEPEVAPARVLWKRISNPYGGIDLGKPYPGDNQVAYLQTGIWSPVKKSVLLRTKSNDTLKVWLNGEVVHEVRKPRLYRSNDDEVAVTLRPGWNDLRMKVVNYTGVWKAGAKLATVEGLPLEDVRISADGGR